MNGLLLVDKPCNFTSHDVVARIRRIFGQKSVGHTGTLDPFASGLMVILLGEATKLSDYLRDSSKTYEADVSLGVTTDSLDRTGEVNYRGCTDKLEALKADMVFQSSLKLQGEMKLPIPLFSAKKVKGRPLHDYVRKGDENQLGEKPEKVMHFFDVLPQKYSSPRLSVKLSCHSGGFIRSWALELGNRLGVGGHLAELRRIECCGYRIDQAKTIEQLDEIKNNFSDISEGIQSLGESFVPLNEALPHWKTVTVKGKDLVLLKNGQVSHDLSRRLIFEQKQAQKTNKTLGIRVVNGIGGDLVSLLEARPQSRLKIKRVFQL